MKKILFYLLFLIPLVANAQTKKQQNVFQEFIYYVDVKNVNTKTICLTVENDIAKKNGVTSFKTVGFPSKYFILKTTKPVSQSELSLWLKENDVTIEYFGEGKKSLEELIFNKRKK